MNRTAILHVPGRKGAAAFTLIELLTVIAIIAVIAGILMPVMGAVRARADSVQCASNLRQIGNAIGGYAGDNDGTLPGPLATGQMPTYTNSDATSLAADLVKYLGLPAATSAAQTARIFVCPAYAKVTPGLDQPVYAVQQVSNAVGRQWPFGVPGDATQAPMKLAALTAMTDSIGKPIPSATTIALRDYTMLTGTLATTTVTFSTAQPAHRNILNALFFDWHVGPVDAATLAPK